MRRRTFGRGKDLTEASIGESSRGKFGTANRWLMMLEVAVSRVLELGQRSGVQADRSGGGGNNDDERSEFMHLPGDNDISAYNRISTLSFLPLPSFQDKLPLRTNEMSLQRQ